MNSLRGERGEERGRGRGKEERREEGEERGRGGGRGEGESEIESLSTFARSIPFFIVILSSERYLPFSIPHSPLIRYRSVNKYKKY
jgi:hypothetical protein